MILVLNIFKFNFEKLDNKLSNNLRQLFKYYISIINNLLMYV
jgi:hypothetical protein